MWLAASLITATLLRLLLGSDYRISEVARPVRVENIWNSLHEIAGCAGQQLYDRAGGTGSLGADLPGGQNLGREIFADLHAHAGTLDGRAVLIRGPQFGAKKCARDLPDSLTLHGASPCGQKQAAAWPQCRCHIAEIMGLVGEVFRGLHCPDQVECFVRELP